MNFLIAQGNSHYKIFVKCNMCGREQVWMKLFPDKYIGLYYAICGACLKEVRRRERVSPKSKEAKEV